MSLPIASFLPSDLVLPALGFLAESRVLTLATLRTIAIARGKKLPAALLGFFEVSIWLFAIGQVMQNLSNLSCAVAFAAGFSLGNFMGILIEQKLALGNLTVQITTKRDLAVSLSIDCDHRAMASPKWTVTVPRVRSKWFTLLSRPGFDSRRRHHSEVRSWGLLRRSRSAIVS